MSDKAILAEVERQLGAGLLLLHVEAVEEALFLQHGGEVDLGFGRFRFQLEAQEVRNCDGRQNADDGDDDHELDQREALLASSNCLDHGCFCYLP